MVCYYDIIILVKIFLDFTLLQHHDVGEGLEFNTMQLTYSLLVGEALQMIVVF